MDRCNLIVLESDCKGNKNSVIKCLVKLDLKVAQVDLLMIWNSVVLFLSWPHIRPRLITTLYRNLNACWQYLTLNFEESIGLNIKSFLLSYQWKY